MPKHGACCLASINLSEFVTEPYTGFARFDYDGFVEAVHIGIRALDTLIDENYNRHPLKQQREMSFNYRNIGLGAFGYASALMKMGLTYGSVEANEFTDGLFFKMFREAVKASNKLAKEKGAFPKYKDCVWDSEIIKKHFTEKEIAAMKKYGLRNCSLLSIAPNGSLATLLAESGGCEPEFAIKYTRRTVGMTDGQDTLHEVYCKTAREYMEANHTDKLPKWFITSHEIPWQDRVTVQAIMQDHIDTAISSTVNMPQSATKDDIAQMYLMAWELGCKGITMFRDGCKRLGILTTDSTPKDTEATFVKPEPLPRGAIVECSDGLVGKKRKIVSGCGSLHIAAFFDPADGSLQEVYLAKGSTGGCGNSLTGLSRMISLLCRAGVDIATIKDQLDSTGVCPSYATRTAISHDTSKGSCCPMAIGNALMDMWNEMQDDIMDESDAEVESTIQPKDELDVVTKPVVIDGVSVCPECGAELVREGGCVQCKSCGWSKCG